MLNEFRFWISLGSGGIKFFLSARGDLGEASFVGCLGKESERTLTGYFESVVKKFEQSP